MPSASCPFATATGRCSFGLQAFRATPVTCLSRARVLQAGPFVSATCRRQHSVRVRAHDSGTSSSSSTTSRSSDAGTSTTSSSSSVQWNFPAQSDHQRRFCREDYELLPNRIVLIRHAESQGNVAKETYSTQPDHTVVLTDKGREQARAAGRQIHTMIKQAHGNSNHKLFIMTSPYTRTLQTTDHILEAFTDDEVAAVRSAVQLREQDFGNFQDPLRITQDLNDRMKFGRFWFRFPNGESGADVYDRLTVFEDHLTRDIIMGRFINCSLLLVTHGLTLRIFLMRWFHWSVEDFLQVYNPNNGDPVVLEKHPWEVIEKLQGNKWVHVKQCYALTKDSRAKLKGVSADMADYLPRSSSSGGAKTLWLMQRAAQQLDTVCAKLQAKPPPEVVLPPGVKLSDLPPGVRNTASRSLVLQSIAEDPYGSLSEDEALDWWRGGVARSVVLDDDDECTEAKMMQAAAAVVQQVPGQVQAQA